MADAGWTFFSNHTHVLFCLAADGGQTLREVASKVGVTERAVQRIVADLEEAGVLERERDGRRNTYRMHADVPLRHAVEAHCRVGDLIALVVAEPAVPLATSKPRAAARKAVPKKRTPR
ncbi:helix-turn-helix transcriptional regulator [Cognatilysobacter lacus]|uniref:Winged helix-turn-helix transcriptional regulator n=1 Tax=Cognatilysobacter lacus TaxID=1643323 RepID=A0A5D8YX76_9GAMM|nr:winged helix-turn-helix domain-containing protein [Lysobacter lacus]TZF87049.1 winged helix-turn-helix transcriptional regulator [Lysobacter lacus]